MASDELSRLFDDGGSLSEDVTSLTEHLARLASSGSGHESMLEVAAQLRTQWRDFHDQASILTSIVVRHF